MQTTMSVTLEILLGLKVGETILMVRHRKANDDQTVVTAFGVYQGKREEGSETYVCLRTKVLQDQNYLIRWGLVTAVTEVHPIELVGYINEQRWASRRFFHETA